MKRRPAAKPKLKKYVKQELRTRRIPEDRQQEEMDALWAILHGETERGL